MERIEDHEIGPLWLEHFPKYKRDVRFKALVLIFCKILQNKARHDINYDDWSDKCHHVLVKFGIPKDQFEEIEKQIEPSD